MEPEGSYCSYKHRVTDTPETKCEVHQIYSFMCALRHNEHNFFVHFVIKEFAGSPQY
jgi:hypothetical protein